MKNNLFTVTGVRTVLSNTALAIIYITISLSVGEVHPFSNYPVYNSLPNWSYVFYITDSSGELLPWHDHTTTDAGGFAQKYYTIALKNDIRYGYGLESRRDMKKIVNIIVQQGDVTFQTSADTVLIKRRYYHVDGHSIVENDTTITAVDPDDRQ